MVYYGWLTKKNDDPNIIYSILLNALLHMPKNLPLRGPEYYQEKSFIYRNLLFGKLKRFHGIESIAQENKIIYYASYNGGLVDVRKGI